jgi:hypothetical protein
MGKAEKLLLQHAITFAHDLLGVGPSLGREVQVLTYIELPLHVLTIY